MTIYSHLTEFMGRPVEDYQRGLANPVRIAYRVSHREDIAGELERLLREPNIDQLQALVIGAWGEAMDVEPQGILATLINARTRLRRLKVFFLGDIVVEQSELSWIRQTDVSTFLESFPELLHIGIRGGEGLHFHKISHPNLRTLIVETAGLSPDTLAEICALSLPSLEHLELWLGKGEYYGKESSVADLAPIFSGALFPKLKRLGLRNCGYTDQICEALQRAPVLDQISYLDLSLGTLSDQGAEFLLQNPKIAELATLSLQYHFLSEEMQEELKSVLPKVLINLEHKMIASYVDKNGEPQRYYAVPE